MARSVYSVHEYQSSVFKYTVTCLSVTPLTHTVNVRVRVNTFSVWL